MNENKAGQAGTYQIKVQGVLQQPLADWLGDLQVTSLQPGETLLVGWFADQPALRGLMDQLWNLNFILLAVERVAPSAAPEAALTEPPGTDTPVQGRQPPP